MNQLSQHPPDRRTRELTHTVGALACMGIVEDKKGDKKLCLEQSGACLPQSDDNSQGYNFSLHPRKVAEISTELLSMSIDSTESKKHKNRLNIESESVLSTTPENLRQSLLFSIGENDDEAYRNIKILIQRGVSVESDEEFSPISSAAMKSNDKIFELILEQNPTPQNSYLDTALMVVCRDTCIERKIKRFDQLLKKGWRLDKSSKNSNETPLLALIKARIDFSFVFENFYQEIGGKRLLNMGDYVFGELIMCGHENVVKHIINHNDFKLEILGDSYGYYIASAVWLGCFEIAFDLLNKYPDDATFAVITRQLIFDHMSLSSHEKMQDYKKFIIALEARQVNINESYSFFPGRAPLAPIHSAISNLNIPYIQALLECRADTSILTDDGLNLLQFTTNLLDDSSNDFASVIKILALLKKYLDESKFDESSKDQLSARAKISQHEKRDDILKALNMESHKKVTEKDMDIF